MSDSVQRGHEQRTPDATVITLSTPIVEEIGIDRARTLAEGIGRLTTDRLSAVQVDERLHALMREAGLHQPEVLVSNMADRIYQATDVTVVTDDDQVLYGDPSWSPQTIDPGVEGTEDPEHGDRPTYS